MIDRGMKKWKPFNAVIPGKELKKKEEILKLPNLSRDEIAEYEDILLSSMYTHSKVTIFFIEDGKYKEITDFVLKLDSNSKNIYLSTKKINFRQIKKVKK